MSELELNVDKKAKFTTLTLLFYNIWHARQKLQKVCLYEDSKPAPFDQLHYTVS